jgi:hypothetical protein
VLGVGTTGAHVLANIERIFYEVLGDTKLDLFRLLVIETDTAKRESERAPGGALTHTVDAFEGDIGHAISNLSHFLGSDFDWCPRGLDIGPGRGAGNIRAGGRLMFHSKYPTIQAAIQRAMVETTENAGKTATIAAIQRLFQARGLETPAGVVEGGHSVVYVVGTLAGGTCSGMCVDLGYSIRQIDPQAERVGIFFVPDFNASDTFRQNAWAALKDLEYFIDHPDDFRAVWFSEQRTRLPYTRGRAKPYDRIYLISSLNQSGQIRLTYRTDAQAPLVVMAGTMLAADLLGGHALRAGRLVNLNQHVTGDEKRRTFLNLNLRAISYPKYEISEAAACKVVADKICAHWLSTSEYTNRAGISAAIQDENERARGREFWNNKFGSVWQSTGPSVDLQDWIDKMAKGHEEKPVKTLKYQFTSDAQNTIFSKVAQTGAARLPELKALIETGLRERADQCLNLRCLELFLEGIKSEIELTLRYWEQLAIPNRTTSNAWTSLVDGSVKKVLATAGTLVYRTAGARYAVLDDGLSELRTRLSMHVMTGTLQETLHWIVSDRLVWLANLRQTLQGTEAMASERGNQIVSRLLQDRSGPVLRVSRSKSEGFALEVDQLAAERNNAMSLPFLEIFAKTRAAEPNRPPNDLFLRLKNEVQPELLRALVSKGYVNIAEQLRDQHQVDQAVIYLRNTLGLSLATHPFLQTSHTAVPSYIIAKDDVTAHQLVETMRQTHAPGLQEMELKQLPMFDHMVIFYQEGADMDPSCLDGADQYRASYDQRMKENPSYLDPLGYMKQNSSGRISNA